jgi:hypothetical protein
MKNIQITKDNLVALGFTDNNHYLTLRINKDISLQFHCYERDDDYITMCVSNDDFEDSLHYNLKHIKTIKQVKSLYKIMTDEKLKKQKPSTIEKLKLTDKQVHKIVLEWYTRGMCHDIFQNEEGEDLEEYLEDYVYG